MLVLRNTKVSFIELILIESSQSVSIRETFAEFARIIPMVENFPVYGPTVAASLQGHMKDFLMLFKGYLTDYIPEPLREAGLHLQSDLSVILELFLVSAEASIQTRFSLKLEIAQKIAQTEKWSAKTRQELQAATADLSSLVAIQATQLVTEEKRTALEKATRQLETASLAMTDYPISELKQLAPAYQTALESMLVAAKKKGTFVEDPEMISQTTSLLYAAIKDLLAAGQSRELTAFKGQLQVS